MNRPVVLPDSAGPNRISSNCSRIDTWISVPTRRVPRRSLNAALRLLHSSLYPSLLLQLLHANAGRCSLATVAMSELDPVLHFAFPALEVFELEFAPWDQPPPARANGLSTTHEEERRRRRKISNRESARRSRMRRQRHLEGLRREADRLGAQTRGLADRLGALRYYTALFRRDNARLRSESTVLNRRLFEIRLRVYTCRLCGWLS
ncbi:hypothetical protein Cni_G07186 [Canna indica]|uniref:BZIP domain-containing protein n=1 Tax=Canna indica TaxID=4628 RepID=A0AAQ3JZY6_9LILI|nr:hypothetical protein Cni_G07186 [Canna indica]